MHDQNQSHRSILTRIARSAVIDGGLLPDFSPEALAGLASIRGPAAADQVRDSGGGGGLPSMIAGSHAAD